MNIIDQLGAERHGDSPFDVIRCKAIRGDDRIKYGFDLLRSLNIVGKNLKREGYDVRLSFLDDEDKERTTQIPFEGLRNLLEQEYPLGMQVRQEYLEFLVGFRLDFPVIYFDTDQPENIDDVPGEMQRSLFEILNRYLPDDYEGGTDVVHYPQKISIPKEQLINNKPVPHFLAGRLIEHEDFRNTVFSRKYLEFPSWKEALTYARSNLFKDEIAVRSDWKRNQISNMEQNIFTISQYLIDTSVFEDVVEECSEWINSKLNKEVNCEEVLEQFDTVEDRAFFVIDVLYDKGDFSLYEPYEFNSLYVSDEVVEIIKSNFKCYATHLQNKSC